MENEGNECVLEKDLCGQVVLVGRRTSFMFLSSTCIASNVTAPQIGTEEWDDIQPSLRHSPQSEQFISGS